MEETSKDCRNAGLSFGNYAQEIRSSLLDDLTKSELAEAGIKGLTDSLSPLQEK
jgi:hypothetical protein